MSTNLTEPPRHRHLEPKRPLQLRIFLTHSTPVLLKVPETPFF